MLEVTPGAIVMRVTWTTYANQIFNTPVQACEALARDFSADPAAVDVEAGEVDPGVYTGF